MKGRGDWTKRAIPSGPAVPSCRPAQGGIKPLEERRWCVLVSLCLSLAAMFGLWQIADLHITSLTCSIYLFSTLGIWNAANRLVARALIKAKPSLGAIA